MECDAYCAVYALFIFFHTYEILADSWSDSFRQLIHIRLKRDQNNMLFETITNRGVNGLATTNSRLGANLCHLSAHETYLDIYDGKRITFKYQNTEEIKASLCRRHSRGRHHWSMTSCLYYINTKNDLIALKIDKFYFWFTFTKTTVKTIALRTYKYTRCQSSLQQQQQQQQHWDQPTMTLPSTY